MQLSIALRWLFLTTVEQQESWQSNQLTVECALMIRRYVVTSLRYGHAALAHVRAAQSHQLKFDIHPRYHCSSQHWTSSDLLTNQCTALGGTQVYNGRSSYSKSTKSRWIYLKATSRQIGLPIVYFQVVLVTPNRLKVDGST